MLVAEVHDGRTRLCEAIAQSSRLALVACVADAAAAVARAVELRPDVCILESSLPLDALAAVTEIGARLPNTHVLVATDDPVAPALDAITAGASGLIDRSAAPGELIRIADAVAAGEVVLTREQITELVAAVRDPAPLRRRVAVEPRLTAREWQVLELLREQHTMPAIADELFLSPATVRSHVHSIRRKLGSTYSADARPTAHRRSDRTTNFR